MLGYNKTFKQPIVTTVKKEWHIKDREKQMADVINNYVPNDNILLVQKDGLV